MNNYPLVSVGIPTFNRPEGLKRTLNCIVNQTYKNLEIIVSDNCSQTKETENFVRELSLKDSRILFTRQHENIGGVENFKFVLGKSKGEFFKWIADDDWIDLNYVESCVNFLISNPDYCAAYGYAKLYDKQNEYVKDDTKINLEHAYPQARVKYYFQNVLYNGTFYALVRRGNLDTLKISNKLADDWLLVARIAFLGKFKLLENTNSHISLGGASKSVDNLTEVLDKNKFTRSFPFLSVGFNIFKDILYGSDVYKSFNIFKRGRLSFQCSKIIWSRFGVRGEFKRGIRKYIKLKIGNKSVNRLKRILSKIQFFAGYTREKYYKQLVTKYHKFNPPGHYYTPIPDEKEIPDSLSIDYNSEIPGIDLNEKKQVLLLEKLKEFYSTSLFPSEKTEGNRYYFNNDHIGYSDGIFLSAILQYFKPKKIIEVGSGFSSALMLDINEKILNGSIDLTFIEPFPDERLNNLIKTNDKCKVIRDLVQNIKSGIWSELAENDILFIDSSHVLKFRSDLEYMFFIVLPLLNKGVIVHFHDVFFPFEYPVEWLKQGRAWNEAYSLRAFLQFNNEFEILLFNSFLEGKFPDWFRENMPLCLKANKKLQLNGKEVMLNTTGQSIFIRRK
jgi:glycosyltransferase involved in cell wall biosynthesis/predicted O-methyltransferase YrrM